MILKKTSSAGTEISEGSHKGGIRRAGPNNFVVVYSVIQRGLSSIIFVFIFCFFSHVFKFLILETIHNIAIYT